MEPSTLQRLTGNMGDGGGDADPFAPAGGGNDGAADDGIKIKTFLENTGIPFDDSKGHKFAFDGFQMSVTHERRYLDLIERILAKLDKNSGIQVEIEAKFLEVQEGALDEISFDWQYSWGNANLLYDPETLLPQVDSRGNLAKSYESVVTGNTPTWQLLTHLPV